MPFGRELVRAGLVLAALTSPGRAQEVDAEPTRVNRAQPVAVPEPTKPAPPSEVGGWTFGGAIRARADTLLDAADPVTGERRTARYLAFDTLILKAAYNSDTLFAAAQYRFYGGDFPYTRAAGYTGPPGEINFPVFAYVGWKFSGTDSIAAGINQVPFGIVPYFGISFLETLAFPMGIEDVHNFGVKYSHTEPDLNWQVAYYPSDGGNWFGISRDSARYTANIVTADPYVPFGSNNSEKDMLVGRVERTVYRSELASVTLGASVWFSRIVNTDTRLDGTKAMQGLHAIVTYGPWTFRAVGVRQDIDPKNPGRRDLVTMGGFDASYLLAARGTFASGEIAYKIEDVGPFSEVVPYLNYSTFLKDRTGFRDSERFILGTALTVRDVAGLYIYPEVRLGRNDPYTGAGQYLTGLGPGGDGKWKTTLFTSIGYYF